MKKQIIWDWNGTLLNDVWYCMRVRNRVFPPIGIRGVESIEQYRHEFTFPIRQYYKNAGISDEMFEKAAHVWMNEYTEHFADVDLYPDTIPVLKKLRQTGLRQVILSATELDMLEDQVGHFPICAYFDKLYGLQDIYARSKVDLGLKCLRESGISAKESLMIGDSLHDAQVAGEMGTDCLLICRGHQPREKLAEAGVPVLEKLTDIIDYL